MMMKHWAARWLQVLLLLLMKHRGRSWPSVLLLLLLLLQQRNPKD